MNSKALTKVEENFLKKMMLKNKEKTKRRNFATFSPEPAIKSSYKLLKEDILPKPSNFKITEENAAVFSSGYVTFRKKVDMEEEEKKEVKWNLDTKEVVNSLNVHLNMIEKIQHKLSEVKTSRYRLVSLGRLRRKIRLSKLAKKQNPYDFELKKLNNS